MFIMALNALHTGCTPFIPFMHAFHRHGHYGQLLLILSWPMLCLWVAAELLVQLQARFEEEAMQARHGALCRDYRAAVRRWL